MQENSYRSPEEQEVEFVRLLSGGEIRGYWRVLSRLPVSVYEGDRTPAPHAMGIASDPLNQGNRAQRRAAKKKAKRV